ncbi:hypothetical protein FDP41_008916 [Naegleria fowleri]|uniref:PX domain-containing protein n=1 Tax=Naegleria fowleri TaxID=5763 RepID=A0A6A5B3K8_NAEFO|nr:uncharacterized protein FDP41_008916 [Naegleria fowleri]KAF0972667.1 hypothetical protein FDP41_008916 [Naegleria fowleri]CAG4718384.1 unnamed protein product [Naegleria fowleri]
MFDITIVSHTLVTASTPYVLYCISIQVDDLNAQWSVERRYSQLRDLHTELANYFQNLPDFPPKYWKGNLKEQKISERQTLLNQYFKTLTRRDDIFKAGLVPLFVLQFFSAPAPVKELYVNPSLTLRKSSEKLIQTLNDDVSPSGMSDNSPSASSKRRSGSSYDIEAEKPINEWTVDEVASWILQLNQVYNNNNNMIQSKFTEVLKSESIDGSVLIYLTTRDMIKMGTRISVSASTGQLNSVVSDAFASIIIENILRVKEAQKESGLYKIGNRDDMGDTDDDFDEQSEHPESSTFMTTTTTTTAMNTDYDDDDDDLKQDLIGTVVPSATSRSDNHMHSISSSGQSSFSGRICPEFNLDTELTKEEQESYNYCMKKIMNLKDPVPESIRRRLCQDLVIPQRFKFKYLNPNSIPQEVLMMNSRRKEGPYLKIKLIITELGEGFTHRTIRRLGSLVGHNEIKSSEFGLFHSSLIIGPVQLEWTDNSIVVPRKEKSSSKAVFAVDVCKIRGQENLNDIYDKLAHFCTFWNGHRLYVQKDTNCQHFVVELLKAIGVYNQFKKNIESTILGKYLNKLKEFGTCEMSYIIPEHLAQRILKECKDEISSSLKQLLQTSLKGKEIVFNSHSVLDEYYETVLKVEPTYFDLGDHKKEEELLKAYDRAFWLRRQSSKLSNDPRVKPLRDPCPFDTNGGANTVKEGAFYLGDYAPEYPVPSTVLNQLKQQQRRNK